jgi:hypothetical protein
MYVVDNASDEWVKNKVGKSVTVMGPMGESRRFRPGSGGKGPMPQSPCGTTASKGLLKAEAIQLY